MENHARESYQRWKNKADDYDNSNLTDYFDKYFSLFVAYNILYNENAKKLFNEHKINKNQYGQFPDKQSATQYIIKNINRRSFKSKLNSQIKVEINKIFNLIPNTFYIYNQSIDCKLKKDWQEKECILAVLKVLYGIRCNMFHGEKGFEEHQKDLLKPAILVLQEINNILYEKLTDQNN